MFKHPEMFAGDFGMQAPSTLDAAATPLFAALHGDDERWDSHGVADLDPPTPQPPHPAN